MISQTESKQLFSPSLPSSWPRELKEGIQQVKEAARITEIRNLLGMIETLPSESRGRTFRLGIARTFTIESQVDALRLVMATCPCQPEIQVGDLENIEQELLDPDSKLLSSRPNALLVLWRLEELHPQLAFESEGWPLAKRKEAMQHLLNRIQSLCENYLKVGNASLFLSTLPDPRALSLSDIHTDLGLKQIVTRINLEILSLASRRPHIFVFDFAGWASGYGAGAFDLKMDLLARQPIATKALFSFCLQIRRTLRPLIAPPAKVLALDLDNTLWGGILGEDGPEGLKIGHDVPGIVYLRIQRLVKNLKKRGILLVLLSKNNLGDVEEAFSSLHDMALSLSDFSAIRVNWRPKAENLREVAQELNLGLDSFVFADDEFFEREEMAYLLPEVKILPVNEDPLAILESLMSTDLFEMLRVGEEDRNRSEEYVRQRKRGNLAERSGSVENFLKSLDLRAQISPVSDNNLARVVQMLGKINQFNLTTRRHSEADIRRFIESPKNILLSLALSDRFGDQGIVGLLIALIDSRAETLKLDSFLLSCRALGRGAEFAFWSHLLTKASALGYKGLTAEYLACEKNGQVADLYERLGMTLIEQGEKYRRYHLALPAQFESPDWISLNEPREQG